MRRRSNWMVFRWPLLIGAIGLIGLLAALVGDGGWDVVSWLALGGTVLVMPLAWRKGGAGR